MHHWEIVLLFLLIAFVYASVGFGGGSSYLAVLTFYAIPFQEMKLIALVCNIIVVSGGTLIFIRHRQLNWARVIPLAVLSVPFAFLGARLHLREDVFFVILGFSLIGAAVLLWLRTTFTNHEEAAFASRSFMRDGALGGAIGFLSGMVGIGGGIFLSPILNLIKWDTPVKVAATASFFILVNSLAGIAGQAAAMPAGFNYMQLGLLAAAVLIGGQAGARMGIKNLNPLAIRRITAVVVGFAGIEVLHKHLHFWSF